MGKIRILTPLLLILLLSYTITITANIVAQAEHKKYESEKFGYFKIQSEFPFFDQPSSPVLPPTSGSGITSGSTDDLLSGLITPSNQSGSTTLSSQPKGNISRLLEQEFPPSAGEGLVFVVYESPTMVILYGDLLTFGLTYNQNLWKAAELLRNDYGYDIIDTLVSGIGSDANPERFYVILEKVKP